MHYIRFQFLYVAVAAFLLASSGRVPAAGPSAAPPAGRTGPGFILFLAGDSTMADKPVIPPNPERGWGQLLPLYFNDAVRVENHAVNGRSSKSFIDEGRWAAITNRLRPGDFVIIQFGHNDEKKNDPERYTEPFGSFETNLIRFVREARQHDAVPILATPVARRKFDAQGHLVDTHGDYVTAVRQVAQEQKVPLLDLNRDSMELLARLGPDSSKRLFDWIPAGEFERSRKGWSDDTHFNAYGACRMCDLAAAEIATNVPALGRWLRRHSEADVNQPAPEK